MLLHGEGCQWYHPHVWNAKHKACAKAAPPANDDLKEALGNDWAGIVVFEYQQLVAHAVKAEVLKKYLIG
jgi:hypothetical protein